MHSAPLACAAARAAAARGWTSRLARGGRATRAPHQRSARCCMGLRHRWAGESCKGGCSSSSSWQRMGSAALTAGNRGPGCMHAVGLQHDAMQYPLHACSAACASRCASPPESPAPGGRLSPLQQRHAAHSHSLHPSPMRDRRRAWASAPGGVHAPRQPPRFGLQPARFPARRLLWPTILKQEHDIWVDLLHPLQDLGGLEEQAGPGAPQAQLRAPVAAAQVLAREAAAQQVDAPQGPAGAGRRRGQAGATCGQAWNRRSEPGRGVGIQRPAGLQLPAGGCLPSRRCSGR